MRRIERGAGAQDVPAGDVCGALPRFLATMVADEPDDRPVPALGFGDQDAAVALLAATRAVLLAQSDIDVITAVARFSLDMGGRLVPATRDRGTAVPVDIALGVGPPVLVDADMLSISRMRLEQFLPTLIEDARSAISRRRHLEDVQAASATDPLTGLLSRRELMRRLATVHEGDALCRIDFDRDEWLGDGESRARAELVLGDLGLMIRDNLSGNQDAGRYGANEIVVICRGVPEPTARQQIRHLQDLWREGGHGSASFSAGAADVGPGGWPDALNRAEAAIYEARTRGNPGGWQRAEGTA